jgi:hypothetical protein
VSLKNLTASFENNLLSIFHAFWLGKETAATTLSRRHPNLLPLEMYQATSINVGTAPPLTLSLGPVWQDLQSDWMSDERPVECILKIIEYKGKFDIASLKCHLFHLLTMSDCKIISIETPT